jgi:uncharacterized protein YjbJ (UPF0337 family)
MGEKIDKASGRIKQAAGDLSDDNDLKAEGRADESAGKAKGFVADLTDKVEDVIDSVKDKLKDRHN